jgi:hypothetical protein
MDSASLCSLAGRYDNPIPTRCLAPIDCSKIPALDGEEGIADMPGGVVAGYEGEGLGPLWGAGVESCCRRSCSRRRHSTLTVIAIRGTVPRDFRLQVFL